MVHWTWWLSGLSLAGVALVNWFVVRRMLAVSGRFSGLVDRFRDGPAESGSMSADEMIAAVRAATLESFGSDGMDGAAAPVKNGELRVTAVRAPIAHLIFFASLAAGGAVSMLLATGIEPTFGLRSELFAKLTGQSGVWGPVVLLAGGMLVGFGTRMAAGCTSGHGLCGVSRVQPGSLVATAAFFGVGIVASIVLGGFL
jgi:uncharacterized membrane protein YedE/YeeE